MARKHGADPLRGGAPGVGVSAHAAAKASGLRTRYDDKVEQRVVHTEKTGHEEGRGEGSDERLGRRETRDRQRLIGHEKRGREEGSEERRTKRLERLDAGRD